MSIYEFLNQDFVNQHDRYELVDRDEKRIIFDIGVNILMDASIYDFLDCDIYHLISSLYFDTKTQQMKSCIYIMVDCYKEEVLREVK